jgi:tetratricopeptide (TPR) repeat protein
VERVDELRESALDVWTQAAAVFLPVVYAARGDRSGLEAALDRLGLKSDWREHKVLVAAAQGVVMRETGNLLEAFATLRDALLSEIGSGLSHVPLVFAETVETAFAAGEADAAKELLDRIERLSPAQLTPLLEAEAAHARGRLAAHDRDLASAAHELRRALELFARIEAPFARARVQLHLAEVLAESGKEPERAQELRDEAAAVFEQLRAAPWLERARSLERAVAA